VEEFSELHDAYVLCLRKAGPVQAPRVCREYRRLYMQVKDWELPPKGVETDSVSYVRETTDPRVLAQYAEKYKQEAAGVEAKMYESK